MIFHAFFPAVTHWVTGIQDVSSFIGSIFVIPDINFSFSSVSCSQNGEQRGVASWKKVEHNWCSPFVIRVNLHVITGRIDYFITYLFARCLYPFYQMLSDLSHLISRGFLFNKYSNTNEFPKFKFCFCNCQRSASSITWSEENNTSESCDECEKQWKNSQLIAQLH